MLLACWDMGLMSKMLKMLVHGYCNIFFFLAAQKAFGLTFGSRRISGEGAFLDYYAPDQ